MTSGSKKNLKYIFSPNLNHLWLVKIFTLDLPKTKRNTFLWFRDFEAFMEGVKTERDTEAKTTNYD